MTSLKKKTYGASSRYKYTQLTLLHCSASQRRPAKCPCGLHRLYANSVIEWTSRSGISWRDSSGPRSSSLEGAQLTVRIQLLRTWCSSKTTMHRQYHSRQVKETCVGAKLEGKMRTVPSRRSTNADLPRVDATSAQTCDFARNPNPEHNSIAISHAVSWDRVLASNLCEQAS